MADTQAEPKLLLPQLKPFYDFAMPLAWPHAFRGRDTFPQASHSPGPGADAPSCSRQTTGPT